MIECSIFVLICSKVKESKERIGKDNKTDELNEFVILRHPCLTLLCWIVNNYKAKTNLG